jgi:hypothetical protein
VYDLMIGVLTVSHGWGAFRGCIIMGPLLGESDLVLVRLLGLFTRCSRAKISTIWSWM